MESKAFELVKQLIDKTREKSVSWTASPEIGDQFVLEMSKGVVLVDKDESVNNSKYYVTLVNANGTPVNLLHSDDGPDERRLANELFQAAENSYLQVDETIDAIIAELNSK